MTLLATGLNKEITVVGIIVIALPLLNNQINKKYKVTQCLDKNAEIDLSIKITSFETINLNGQINNASRVSEVSEMSQKHKPYGTNKVFISPFNKNSNKNIL